MPIIADIYDKIASVLDDLTEELGADARFTADEVVCRYQAKYPVDRDYMEQRRRANPTSHSLPGFLDGMLSDYSKLDSPPGRRIKRLGPLEYRFL